MNYKNTCLIIALTLAFFQSNSQVSIPYDSLKMKIGERYFDAISEYIGTGDSGENVIWDFSSLTKTSAIESRSLATDSFIVEASYIDYSPSDNTFLYILEDSSKRELLGTRNGNTGEFIPYKKPLNYLHFPLEYNMEFYDTAIVSNYDSNVEDTVHTTQYTVSKIDGYGTLITPLGTFNNVLRIYKKSKAKVILGTLGTAEYETESFTWYTSGYSMDLLFINILNFNGQISYSTVYLDDPSLQNTKLDSPTNEVSIYPNPTSDYININSYSPNISVVIYDIAGRSVYTGTENKINVSNLESGLYTVVVLDLINSKTYTQKVVIER
jgi:hypothetical protein